MVNYENGKIYKIESHSGDMIYIGSTTKKYLSQRMDTHRNDYKKWKNNKHGFVTSFTILEEYGVENCSIVLLESCPCDSKDELVSREAYYIKKLNCVNKNIPGRTRKEWCEDNKEKIKQYRKDNIDKIAEKKKEYYENNKDKINEKKKEWCENNKDKIKEAKKQY